MFLKVWGLYVVESVFIDKFNAKLSGHFEPKIYI